MTDRRYLVTVEFPGSSTVVWTRACGWLTTRGRADILDEQTAADLIETLRRTCPGSTIERIEVDA